METLKHLRTHPNILEILDIFVGKTNINIVFPFLDMDLQMLLHKTKGSLPPVVVKYLLYSLINALKAVHEIGLMHRDLKPGNVLLDQTGAVKLCDFGQCRVVNPNFEYSLVVGSKWYKAPEILFGCHHYNHTVDMWSVGAVFIELLCHEPAFPGQNDIDQILKIYEVLGSIEESGWKGFEDFLPDYGKIYLP